MRGKQTWALKSLFKNKTGLGARRERSGNRERLFSKRTPLLECSERHPMSVPCRVDTWGLLSRPVQGVKVVWWLSEELRPSWLQCRCLHAHRPGPGTYTRSLRPSGGHAQRGASLGRPGQLAQLSGEKLVGRIPGALERDGLAGRGIQRPSQGDHRGATSTEEVARVYSGQESEKPASDGSRTMRAFPSISLKIYIF